MTVWLVWVLIVALLVVVTMLRLALVLVIAAVGAPARLAAAAWRSLYSSGPSSSFRPGFVCWRPLTELSLRGSIGPRIEANALVATVHLPRSAGPSRPAASGSAVHGGRPAPGLRARCSTSGRAEVMEILGAAALVHE